MIDRKYSCDLCKTRIDEPNLHLMGLEWKSENIELTIYTDTEHHICMNCLIALTKIGIKEKGITL